MLFTSYNRSLPGSLRMREFRAVQRDGLVAQGLEARHIYAKPTELISETQVQFGKVRDFIQESSLLSG